MESELFIYLYDLAFTGEIKEYAAAKSKRKRSILIRNIWNIIKINELGSTRAQKWSTQKFPTKTFSNTSNYLMQTVRRILTTQIGATYVEYAPKHLHRLHRPWKANTHADNKMEINFHVIKLMTTLQKSARISNMRRSSRRWLARKKICNNASNKMVSKRESMPKVGR